MKIMHGSERRAFASVALALAALVLASPSSANHCPNTVPFPDSDLDLWCDVPYQTDPADNCYLTANPNQYNAAQAPSDTCGNLCDADYDQSNHVGAGDFSLFRMAVGPASNPVFDCTDTDPGLLATINLYDLFTCFVPRFGSVPPCQP